MTASKSASTSSQSLAASTRALNRPNSSRRALQRVVNCSRVTRSPDARSLWGHFLIARTAGESNALGCVLMAVVFDVDSLDSVLLRRYPNEVWLELPSADRARFAFSHPVEFPGLVLGLQASAVRARSRRESVRKRAELARFREVTSVRLEVRVDCVFEGLPGQVAANIVVQLGEGVRTFRRAFGPAVHPQEAFKSCHHVH